MSESPNKWDVETRIACGKLMDDWGNIANSGRSRMVESMLHGFLRQHRTLQQGIVRSFVQMLIEWRRLARNACVDARNEASWEFAAGLNDQWYFPFI